MGNLIGRGVELESSDLKCCSCLLGIRRLILVALPIQSVKMMRRILEIGVEISIGQ